MIVRLEKTKPSGEAKLMNKEVRSKETREFRKTSAQVNRERKKIKGIK